MMCLLRGTRPCQRVDEQAMKRQPHIHMMCASLKPVELWVGLPHSSRRASITVGREGWRTGPLGMPLTCVPTAPRTLAQDAPT